MRLAPTLVMIAVVATACGPQSTRSTAKYYPDLPSDQHTDWLNDEEHSELENALKGGPVKGALHHAVAADDLKAVTDLLARGADVNELDAGGETPTSKLCKGGYRLTGDPPRPHQLEIFAKLVEAGADVNLVGPKGHSDTPLSSCLSTKYAPLVELLFNNSRSETDPKAKVDLQREDRRAGKPSLSRVTSPEVARVLIANGADPAYRTADGQNLLDIHQKARRQAMVDFFASLGSAPGTAPKRASAPPPTHMHVLVCVPPATVHIEGGLFEIRISRFWVGAGVDPSGAVKKAWKECPTARRVEHDEVLACRTNCEAEAKEVMERYLKKGNVKLLE